MKHCLALMVCLLSFVPGRVGAQPPATGKSLAVVSAGPTGEVASLAEANEVRIVFSEPMVTLGRIPPSVRPPFVTNRAGHSRRIPLVGHDDSHLHARCEDAAAVCDAIRRHG